MRDADTAKTEASEAVATHRLVPPRVAFVVPAHDEAELIGATVDALQSAARDALEGAPFEIVVVDDASSDGTGDLARQHGARVVRTERRQISAARNAGVAATTSEILFFVDADTLVNSSVVREALRELDRGALGGGAMVRFDGWVPLYARVMLVGLVAMFRCLQYTGGCFVFCRREALLEAGGWNEELFAGEEIELAVALKRLGKRRRIRRRHSFRIVKTRVVTSGRKVRAHSGREVFGLLLRLVFTGRRALRSRKGLEFWYERRAARDGKR